MIPGNLATVYFGSVANHVAKHAADADNLDSSHFVMLIVGFSVTILVVSIIAHVAHKALKKAEIIDSEGQEQEETPPTPTPTPTPA